MSRGWGLLDNCPVSTLVMVIYHYVERNWRILFTLDFCITYTIIKKYYTGEPVNIHINLLINIIQKVNWVLSTKKGYFVVIENM